ncbi:MAG: hypothetical protein JF887_05885 [Candidatus Dormibacteraeota bacterium]|uniref:DUF4267 domain-containing protein n=1 Tax=Candidatus Amunia macphersoniae TaxID=3127014 RepID=A0A934NFR1_9BACT|nr:hypothetical protein [Candidatus Dormibacteraeota bacterium]
MSRGVRSCRDLSRVVLGVLRVANGASALVAPKMLLRRLGVDSKANPAAVYGLRMFGVRTVLIGLDMLSSDDEIRARAVRMAPLIHGSDTVSALVTGVQRDLPRRAAVLATAISGVNVILALLAQRADKPPSRREPAFAEVFGSLPERGGEMLSTKRSVVSNHEPVRPGPEAG